MRKKNWQTWGFFTLLAALIMGPLLAHGYVLTLDLGGDRTLASQTRETRVPIEPGIGRPRPYFAELDN